MMTAVVRSSGRTVSVFPNRPRHAATCPVEGSCTAPPWGDQNDGDVRPIAEFLAWASRFRSPLQRVVM